MLSSVQLTCAGVPQLWSRILSTCSHWYHHCGTTIGNICESDETLDCLKICIARIFAAHACYSFVACCEAKAFPLIVVSSRQHFRLSRGHQGASCRTMHTWRVVVPSSDKYIRDSMMKGFLEF